MKTTRPYKLLQRFFPLPKICLGAAPTFQCLNLMYTDRFSRISEQLRRRRERERERERQEREKKKQSWPVRVRDHSLVLLGCREFLCVCVCVCVSLRAVFYVVILKQVAVKDLRIGTGPILEMMCS